MTFKQQTLLHLGPEGFHQVAYREWGAPDNPKVLLCVHGISRTAKDFDDIADALSAHYRVLCPDMPGRGDSDWMTDKSHYTAKLYLSICGALIAKAAIPTIDWLGTSMGGRLGMTIAAAANSPVRKLIINDIGPHIPQAGRDDNFAHFGTDPRFATEAQGIAYVRETRAAFGGPTTPAAWNKFCRDSLRQLDDGQWTLHYDPGLAITAKQAAATDSWDEWQQIRCPTLVLWGLKSKLLTAPTVAQMKSTGPKAEVFEVPYAGHCPRLENDEQINVVKAFLLR